MSATRHRLVGTVVSNKMQKTIVVRVERLARHPKYERGPRPGQKVKFMSRHRNELPPKPLHIFPIVNFS